MPMALIEIGQQYSKEKEIALMNAVHSALLEIFKVTVHALNVRLLVHETHRFSVPADHDPKLFVVISIDCFSGRSLETKRKLYHCIVDNLYPLGIPKDHIKIVLRENDKENWGILGGNAGCDVDVGYVIEI